MNSAADQIARFRDCGAEAVLAIGHREYGHMAIMPAAAREALGHDFD